MASTSQENKRDDERDFLPEILQEIFQNLNAKDLSKITAVNKLWNEVAIREQKQRGPERTLISVTNANVHDGISVKPKIALMFVAPKVIQYGVKALELDVLKKYKDYFPNYLVAVGLHYVMMDDQLINCNHEMTEGSIVSLLIPEYRDLKIRATYTQHYVDIGNYSEFLNKILPEDSQLKATFIVFAQHHCDKQDLFERLKRRMSERQQRFNLWGAAFDNAPFAAVNRQIDESIEDEFSEPMHSYGRQRNGIFAMSITGTCLKSSSIVISCITKKDEFDKKLIDFRDQLQYKRHTIGLAVGPDEVVDYSGVDLSDIYMTFPEMFNATKRIFTNVSFTGIYDESCLNNYYGFKSKEDDPSQKLEHEMSFSVMILTFD